MFLCVFIVYNLVNIYLLSVPFCYFCCSFYCSVLWCCHAPLLWPPHSSQREGEGGEKEQEVVVEGMWLPASGCDMELYTAELLYHHHPIEAPVSPRKCTLKAKGRKKKVDLDGWAAKAKMGHNHSAYTILGAFIWNIILKNVGFIDSKFMPLCVFELGQMFTCEYAK